MRRLFWCCLKGRKARRSEARQPPTNSQAASTAFRGEVTLPLDTSSGGGLTRDGQPLDEEVNGSYSPETWYHVRIGEVLHERYRVITKLGWGDTSTVWLARDLETDSYVSVKVCANSVDQRTRELDFLLHLRTLKSEHPGSRHVLNLLDHFTIHRREQSFMCLVFNVLGPHLRMRVPKGPGWLDVDWVKGQIWHLLLALDFLHTEAKIIHCDVWEPKILCLIEDKSDLEALEQLEETSPSPRKESGDATVYASRSISLRHGAGSPCLVDFGNSRLSEAAFDDESMVGLRSSWNMAGDVPEKPITDIRRLFGTWAGLPGQKRLYSSGNINLQAGAGRMKLDGGESSGQGEIVTARNSNTAPGAERKEVSEEEKLNLKAFLNKWKNCEDQDVSAKEIMRDPIFEGIGIR